MMSVAQDSKHSWRSHAAILLFLSFAHPIHAAKTPPSKSAKKAVPAAPTKKANADPIELMAAALVANSAQGAPRFPEACKPQPFPSLAIALWDIRNILFPQKGEFEQRDEFDKRKQKTSEILPTLEPYFICQPLADNSEVYFQYNADREVFGGKLFKNQNIATVTRRLPPYIGQTVMGVKFKISSSITFEYNISIEYPDGAAPCLPQNGNFPREFEVKSPIHTARTLKNSGWLIMIGTLTAPFAEMNDQYSDASLDDPSENVTRTYTVHFALKSVHIVAGDHAEVWRCDL
jgi:hypothetical protein